MLELSLTLAQGFYAHCNTVFIGYYNHDNQMQNVTKSILGRSMLVKDIHVQICSSLRNNQIRICQIYRDRMVSDHLDSLSDLL